MPVTEINDNLKDLRRLVASFPTTSGVYLMKAEDGETIYIGKAKDLRARVRTYMTGGDGRLQISYLLNRIHSIETIVTETEEQAFILERDLIKKYKPRFNIKLKDDKAYLSIRIDENADWPRIELVRKVEQDGARYFGPYISGGELRSLLEVIKRVIPLRTCTNTVFFNRQRPCLEYQIKRCSGPCCLPVDRETYAEWVQQAIGILQGKNKAILTQLNAAMEAASEDLRFEEAAAIRDRIEILEKFEAGHNLISHYAENRDVFGIYRDETAASLCILIVRGGRIVDSKMYALFDVRVTDEDLLESSIEQFYSGNRDVPDEILIPFDFENQSLVKAGLKLKKGAALEFLVPKRGSKARLISMAQLNAKHHFGITIAKEESWNEVASELAKVVGLSQISRRIECVDISNFQGSDIVGALVAFQDGQPDKNGYRRYNISFQDKPDDFRAIHEVVTRRLRRGMEEDDLPDLLVIDGGAQQLAMACKAREEVGTNIEIISIAKMRTESNTDATSIEKLPERIFLPYANESIPLAPHMPATKFLQRLRDETHRFVITFHRKKRGGRVMRSALDTIPGVGAERRARLLKHYGSVDSIRAADAEEVAKIGRMPKTLAMKILEKIRAS